MMRLDELTRYGIPKRLIEAWGRRQGETLLPVQSRAVRLGLLGQPGETAGEAPPMRMLVSAPTAAGKSFCAELAIARALTARRKAIMLLPLKSLAEQKHRTFRRTFGALGVKCIIATGDYPENDRALVDSDYDVAVAIYEKFDRLLTSHLDVLRTLGLVVIDEIQTISEPGRGAILERLITRMLASVYRPSLLGLSAVIGEGANAAGRLAEWLGATLAVESARPVDLLRGVAVEGAFRYRSYNSGLEACEPFTIETVVGEDIFTGLMERLREESGSTMVFLKSRRETVEAALRLASAVSWPEAKGGLERLAEEEPSYLNRTLRRVMSRGVAFHNADLSPRQRLVVEKCFIRKEVKTIFATTTLAMGVDLPADTVYLETVKYAGGVYDSRPSLVPVSRAEFDNMAGRAGRTGRPDGRPGRAVALAQSEFERDVLWENYIASGDSTSVRSVFDSMPLEDWVLSMLVSGLAGSLDELRGVFARSLRAAVAPDLPMPAFAETLVRLEQAGLIRSESERLIPTAAGEAAAHAGLTFAQAGHFKSLLKQRHPETDFAWIAFALSCPDWAPPAGLLARHELVEHTPLRVLYQRFDHLIEAARILIGEEGRSNAPDYRSCAALKAALLLEEWRRMVPIQELEQQFQVHIGQIMSLGDTVAHLLNGIAALLESSDQSPAEESLRRLAFGVRYGLEPELQDLHAAFRDVLVRSDFAALAKSGVRRVPDLVEKTPEDLTGMLLCDNKCKRINRLMDRLKQEVYMPQVDVSHQQTTRGRHSGGPRPVSVDIDGSYERERYLVRVDGFPVWLTGKSFKYLTRLAWSRLRQDTGWMYKEDIEQGFNQARYLYRMKNEINDGLSTAWNVFENNRLGYYRLNAEPTAIRVNADSLRNHPDFEVRSLFVPQAQPAVN